MGDWRNDENQAHVDESDGSWRCTPCGGPMRETGRPVTVRDVGGRFDFVDAVCEQCGRPGWWKSPALLCAAEWLLNGVVCDNPATIDFRTREPTELKFGGVARSSREIYSCAGHQERIRHALAVAHQGAVPDELPIHIG